MTFGIIFIAYPWAAIIVSAVFAVLFIYRRRVISGVAAGLWAVYGIYELLMQMRVLCSGECNIRVDLLLIYPALLVISVLAIAGHFRKTVK
jgi:hypothetical protein